MSSSLPARFNLMFLSTPVGPLGSGMGGGVELTIKNIAIALTRRGHHVTIVAPSGSAAALTDSMAHVSVVDIPGTLQKTAQHQTRAMSVDIPWDSVLAHMWTYARTVQQDYHVLLNFAYDWLPFYLTPWFDCPVAHLISMGSLTDAMDEIIQNTHDVFSGTLAVHTQTQAKTFSNSDGWTCLANGLDLSLYMFQPHPGESLAWVGRIAPEKGLEDAIAAVQHCNTPLDIFGTIENSDYWNRIQNEYPNAQIHYRGFLSTSDLQSHLGHCQGLIMTPKWIEAFGNVAIEALACGVPVIAYRRGGPAEIVHHGKTGWLVEPDDIEGLVEAIAHLNQLNRKTCRQHAEAHYSLDAMGDRVLSWLTDVWHRYGSDS